MATNHLAEVYADAHHAVRTAIEKLRSAYPNSREYYTQERKSA